MPAHGGGQSMYAMRAVSWQRLKILHRIGLPIQGKAFVVIQFGAWPNW
jgi:hypothetical protein